MAAIDEKEYTQSFDWKIWKRLGPFLRPYRGAFVSMLVFNGICALVDVVLPLFQKYAIQNFIEKNTLTGLPALCAGVSGGHSGAGPVGGDLRPELHAHRDESGQGYAWVSVPPFADPVLLLL